MTVEPFNVGYLCGQLSAIHSVEKFLLTAISKDEHDVLARTVKYVVDQRRAFSAAQDSIADQLVKEHR